MGLPNKIEISVISKHTVKSSINHPTPERRHLTPFDLASMKIKYIKYGLLFHKPVAQTTSSTVANLLTSFSKTLNLFHPLSGRLVITNHDDDTNSISISLDFTNQGAEFIHASSPTTSMEDITSVGPDISDLFPLNDSIGMHGLERPLLAVQVTELADGLFVSWAINHVVADGASVWHFINTWSLYSRSKNHEVAPTVPVFEPWFIDSCPLPIRLPRNFIDPPRNDLHTPLSAKVENYIFRFSSASVAALKARANEEATIIGAPGKSIQISSLQSLLAHTWRAIARARALKPEDTTTAVVIVGYRNRNFYPVIPKNYFGNVANGVGIRATAKELEEEKLGLTGMRMNKAINSRGEEDVYRWVETWCEKRMIHDGDPEVNNILLMGGSNRFDVYGNDFGWGEPITVRYCWGNLNRSGFVKIMAGKEEGSIDFDVVLREGAIRALLEDEEFMAMVG